jgi:hypothetical protein
MDTTTADNGHHLPTPVEKIGYAIRDGHERMQRGEQEWIEGALVVASSLYAARQRFASDNEFGRWLKKSGHNYFTKDDRAALIAMGADAQILRKAPVARKINSFRLIYQEHKEWFRTIAKPTHSKEPTRGRERIQRRPRRRATKQITYAIRREKLGDDYAKIKGSSLDRTPEMAALLDLRAAAPQQAAALIERAAAGKPVSAIAAITVIKKNAPETTGEQLIEAWKHSKMLRLWFLGTLEAQDQLIKFMQEHRKVLDLQAAEIRTNACPSTCLSVKPGIVPPIETSRLFGSVVGKAGDDVHSASAPTCLLTTSVCTCSQLPCSKSLTTLTPSQRARACCTTINASGSKLF